MPVTLPVPHRHSLTRGRERDARIRWLLDMHPVTAAMLVRLGWFSSSRKARTRLRRLVERGVIRLVGTVARNATGRPEHVYCRWRPKADHLLHEVELTEVCLRLHAARIVRGPHITDSVTRPDAELWINGDKYFLELDRASTGPGKVERERFRQYEAVPHLCLWVCPTDGRRDGLRERAAPIRRTALFATMADAIHDPHAPIWVDHEGRRAALPRDSDRGYNPDRNPER